MQARSLLAVSWTALFGRAALIAVCLLVLQQCSKPTGSTTGPSPNAPSNQPPNTPTPDPTPPGPATFVGAGDIAICDPGVIGQQEATAKLIESIGGQVFTLGDNAYSNGTRENFNCYDKSWGRFKARTRPTPGNHDYATPNGQFYYEYYGDNAGPAGLGYYSYPVGAWHVISLNSDVSAVNGAQEAWLRQDLAANATTRCTLAYWHYPVFSSGPNIKEHGVMRGIYKILYDANVDVVLTGHDHMYERFAPQDVDGRPDPARGIRQFVVGIGGMVPQYSFLSTQPNSEFRFSDPNARDASPHGVLKMTLNADSYSWELITVGRGTLDPGSASCH